MAYIPRDSQDSIDRHAQKILRELVGMGIYSQPEVISVEDCEYLAQLLAAEKTFPNCRLSQHDRDVALRVCEQFRVSRIPELERWAIAWLQRDKEKLEQAIEDCERVIIEMLEHLKQMERDT